MSMYQAFKTDANKESKGVTVDFGQFRTLVRRAGGQNKEYQKTMEALVAPYRRLIQLGVMQEGKMRELLCEGYAKAIIEGWEYMVEEASEDGLGEPQKVWKTGIEVDGEIVPPTVAAVKQVLSEQPDIFDMIKEVAENLRNYRTDDDEAAKGN